MATSKLQRIVESSTCMSAVRKLKDQGLDKDEAAEILLDEGNFDADDIGNCIVKVYRLN